MKNPSSFFLFLDKRLVEGVLLLFAAWTMSSNIAAFAGLSLYGLSILFLCLVSFTLVTVLLLRKRFGASADGTEAFSANPDKKQTVLLPGHWGFLIYCTVLLLFFFYSQNFKIFWWGSAAYLLAALWSSRNALSGDTEVPYKKALVLLWIVAVLMAGVVLITHRSDTDDMNYIGTAVGLADHPQLPVLASDTMYPLEKLPYLFPPYKLESLPSLAAAISVLTGVPAIVLMHLILPPLWSILCVFAHGLLLRCLAPRHWPWLLIALETAFLTLGELHREWGNFSFLRIHQGKSIFLTFFFPLITLYGLKLGRKLELRTAGMLCAAQIGALGMSSTATWAAPVMAGIAVLSGITGLRGQGKRLAVFLLTSVYVLGMAGLLFYTTMDSPLLHTMQGSAIEDYSKDLIRLSLGWSPLTFLAWYVILTVWTICPTALARKFALIGPLIVFLFFLNPFLAPYVVKYVTSAILYWRILWLLPVPLFCAIALASPFYSGQPLRLCGIYFGLPLAGLFVAAMAIPHFGEGFLSVKTTLCSRVGLTMAIFLAGLLAAMLLQEWLRDKENRSSPRTLAFFSILLALFFVFLPSQYFFSPANRVKIHRPGLKVPQEEYLLSKWVAEHFGPQDRVLLPVMQSTWLETFSNHPSPVIIVGYWDQLMRGVWAEQDLQDRIWLREYTSGNIQDPDQDRFRNGLKHYAPAAVSMKQSAPYVEQTRRVLQDTGYTRAHEAFGYEIWTRK